MNPKTLHRFFRKFLPLLIAFTLVAGCRGVLELEIERLPAEPSPALGTIAYIAGGDVWVLDLDSEQLKRITRDGLNSRPLLSADAGWVAYRKSDFLYIADVRTGKEIRVSEAGVSSYVWSPEGAELIFPAWSGLAVWDALTEKSRQISLDLAAIHNLAWRPDGALIAFDTLEGDIRTVQTVSADGNHRTEVYTAGGMMDVPRLAGWSPNGEWLALWVGSRALAAEQDGLPFCFAAVERNELDCTGDLTLVRPEYIDWSAEGLAWIAGAGRETWVGKSLAILPAVDGEPQILVSTAEQAPVYPAWSPDGNQIAYSAGPPVPLDAAYDRRDAALHTRRIWVINVKTGRRTQLTGDSRYRDERPVWTAGGRYILFVRMDDQAAGLWLMNSDGGDLTQLVSEMTPRPDPTGEYGYIAWNNWWHWRSP